MSGFTIPSGSTVSLTNGSRDITVAGADWSLLGIGANAMLWINGRNFPIESVPASGAPQLLHNWADDDVSAASYEVYPALDAYTFSVDAKQFQAYARQMLSSGRFVDTDGMPLSPDCYVGLLVKAVGVNTPPTTPFQYDLYVVGTSPTGDWASAPGKVAIFWTGAWRFYTPFDGLMASMTGSSSLFRYMEGTWTEFGPKSPDLGAVDTAAMDVSIASPGASVGTIAMSGGMTFLNFGSGANAAYGKYVWNGAATPATRSTDADAAGEIGTARVFVLQGTYAGKSYRCMQDAADITLGTTPLSYVLVADESSEALIRQSEVLDLLGRISAFENAISLNANHEVHSSVISTVYWAIRGQFQNIIVAIDSQLRLLVNGLFLPIKAKAEFWTASIQGRQAQYPWALTGKNNNIVVALDESLTFIVHKLRVLQSIAFNGLLNLANGSSLVFGNASANSQDKDWPWAITGSTGKVVLGVKNGDVHLAAVGPSARLAAFLRDNANIARSSGIMQSPHNCSVSSLAAVRQMIMLYGQSLGAASEGWPALSVTHRSDCYMIGSSVRPRSSYDATFAPLTSSVLYPLVATVEVQGSRTASLSTAAVSALAAANQAEGECAVIPVANQLSKAWAGINGDARKFIANTAAVPGQTIEQLSKGASPNLYQRVLDLLTLHKSLATAAGETASVAAILWMQGEWNATSGYGGTTDKDAYKALLVQLRSDMNTDITSTLGQALPPSFFTYVTSATYINDTFHAAVCMAQVEFSLENKGAFCVGPTYPVTDKNGHLDANGYRWFGSMLAKVVSRVLIERKNWEPLYPLKIEQLGRVILIGFNVPSGPLQFQASYAVNTATLFSDCGFRVQDSIGFLTLTSVEVVGSTIVSITVDRDTIGSVYVWYADKTIHGGTGNLCDSDPALSDDQYVYSAGSGQYASANIAALVNKPYPLFNWCPPFYLPVGYERP